MSSRPTHGQFAGKISTMYLNPCEIESQDSLACLERNPNNKKACQKYFDTYKECKREWTRSHREFKNKQRATTNTPKPE